MSIPVYMSKTVDLITLYFICIVYKKSPQCS
jgi:hypothetical protein